MQNQRQQPLAIALTVLSALGRLLPHAPNVTPLGGSCLFAGSRLDGAWAYLLPLVVMLATDPLAYFGHGYTLVSPAIYASFMINVWIGRRLLRGPHRVTPVRVGASAFVCSLQFFLLTNLAVWVTGSALGKPLYSADLAGLLRCYSVALPFWGRTLAGDLLFSGALFGFYELLNRRAARASTAVTA